MSAAASSTVHERVASYVESRTGLSFTGSQGKRLRQAVAKTLPPGKSRAGGDPVTEEVFGALCEALTVQESYFFREPAKLELVKEFVLPGVRTRRGPLRVWSAGCAAGEEAYTLAALFTETGLSGRYRILGTDLSEAAVADARRGSYTKWSVRGLNEERLGKIFETHGSRYHVADRYRTDVDFERHNLLDAPPTAPGTFDLVFCRNVLIYFTPEAARAVVTRLASALAPGGWLVLGVSDPLADGFPGLDTVVTEYGLAYRRRDDDEVAGTVGDADEQVQGGTSTTARRVWARDRGRPVGDARGADAHPGRPVAPQVPAVAKAPRGSASDQKPDQSRQAPPAPPSADVREETAPLTGLLSAAEESLRAARPAEAERLVRTALETLPHERAALLLLVQALAEQARVRDAIASAEEVVGLFPDDVEVRHLHAVVLLERGDAASAAVAARKAVYLDPGFAPAHLVLGRAYELLGDAPAARRARRNGRRLLAEATDR